MELRTLLKQGVSLGASDVHLQPGLPPMLRIDGDLMPAPRQSQLSENLTKQLIYSVMSEEQKKTFETSLELDMSVVFPDVGIFRLNVIHHLNGIAAVFRIIPESPPTFEELSLPTILKSLLALSHGLVLMTGPTGSGKSTTLAAMIEYINTTRSAQIITIEDPIEFIYQSKKSIIVQRQVHRDTLDMSIALRAALRHDPDVIMLGEMRDLETMRLALTAAETGHLVLATLHASSAPLAISRIVDVFPSAEKNRVRNLLAETLQAVICQTLVKKIAGGRVAAFEIMLATIAIRHLIRQDKNEHMSMTIQTNGDIGMCTLEQYLHELVAKRIISNAVARSAAINHDRFQPL